MYWGIIYYQKNERYLNKRARGKHKWNKREMQHPRNLVGGKELLIYLFSLAHRESGEGSDLEGLVKSGIKSVVTSRDVLFDPYTSLHLRKLLLESPWISWSIDSIIHVQAWIERLVDIVRTSFLSQLSYTHWQLHFFFNFDVVVN